MKRWLLILSLAAIGACGEKEKEPPPQYTVERAIGAGAQGQLSEGEQGRSLSSTRENNKERAK